MKNFLSNLLKFLLWLLKGLLKAIIAPFKFIAWLIREIMIYILVHAYKCSVVMPKQAKYELRKKKNGK